MELLLNTYRYFIFNQYSVQFIQLPSHQDTSRYRSINSTHHYLNSLNSDTNPSQFQGLAILDNHFLNEPQI